MIEIEDLSFYEVFHCKVDEIYQTWQLIWEKNNKVYLSGLIRWILKIPPDGLVEIYIAVKPHC